jgi:tetratricopeptide (TPR) repeat protein
VALGTTYERLADAWFTIGLVDPSTKAYREAYSLLRGERVEAARVADKLARIEQRLRRLPQSLARISRELKRLGQDEDARLAKARSLLLTRYALGKLNQGRYDMAIEYGLRALAEGRRADDTECLAQAYSGLHVIHLTAGRPMAEPYGELCLAAYTELGDLVGQAHCTNNLAFQAHSEDRWSDAVEMFDRAATTFASLGDTANEGNATCNQAEVMVNQGRYLEALPLLDRSILAARSTSDDELVALAVRQLGKAYLRAGNVMKGVELLEEARGMFVAIDEHGELPGVDVLLAEALLHDGDAGGALARCRELLAGEARDELEPTLRWLMGFALLEMHDSGRAAEEFQRGVAASRTAGDRYAEALSLLGLATTGAETPEPDPGATSARIFGSMGVSALPRGVQGPAA